MTDIATISETTPLKKHKPISGLVIAGLVLLIVLGSIYGARNYHELNKAQTHSAEVTSQLHHTKEQLSSTKDELSSAQAEVSAAQSTLSVCSIAMEAGRHMVKVVDAEVHAGPADMFSRIGYLQTALRELKATNAVLDQAGYNSIGALYKSCDGGAAANA